MALCKPVGRTLLFMIALLILASCGRNLPTPTATSALPTLTLPASATPTPFEPSPTPEPLAALVNGEEITLEEYLAELARFQIAQPGVSGDALVLADLVDQALLAQAAVQAGFVLDDAGLQARIDQLAQQVGGAQALMDWQASHGYTGESFQVALKRAAAAAWMRDQITASAPETVEQVHARQILLYNSEQANQVLSQIRAGIEFATLASEYDPVMSGDLGWFPRGYLTEKAVEDAAFALQPGEISAVIETPLGFHILEVIERDAQRLLDPDARLTLQSLSIKSWLAERRSQSEIQIFVQ
ncbi:MAG: hypothetical protein EHM70_03245 [Chloroflexota bacterium]|nr:MAG: hypothetical protein EHM70_03245 [Chloroflexota bacterium]